MASLGLENLGGSEKSDPGLGRGPPAVGFTNGVVVAIRVHTSLPAITVYEPHPVGLLPSRDYSSKSPSQRRDLARGLHLLERAEAQLDLALHQSGQLVEHLQAAEKAGFVQEPLSPS